VQAPQAVLATEVVPVKPHFSPNEVGQCHPRFDDRLDVPPLTVSSIGSSYMGCLLHGVGQRACHHGRADPLSVLRRALLVGGTSPSPCIASCPISSGFTSEAGRLTISISATAARNGVGPRPSSPMPHRLIVSAASSWTATVAPAIAKSP
jgi:hypothetical protein